MPSDTNRSPEKVGGTLPLVDLVIPVLNEVNVLERSVAEVRGFLAERFPYPARIVIAENGSKDGTAELARDLAATYDNVQCLVLTQRGRGRALRLAWTSSDADIVAYTDVDLSTDLTALEPMCRAIHEDGYDIAIGSRLLPGSRVKRCVKREVISRSYNLLLRLALSVRFSDAQCGFKAVSRRFVSEIIPLVQDQAWFFDTELLVLGERLGYRVKEVPVIWVEDLDTRVKIIQTVIEDLRGIRRLNRVLKSGDLRPVVAPAVPNPAPAIAVEARDTVPAGRV
jgi:glycosyltransferase involved in cell wall biosynthesis